MKKSVIIGIIVVVVLVVIGSILFIKRNSIEGDVPLCLVAGEESSYEVDGIELPPCCTGLTNFVSVPDGTPEECEEFYLMAGNPSVCTDCGNGNCENWENRCICPEDCEVEEEISSCTKEGESYAVVPGSNLCCEGLTLIDGCGPDPSGNCNERCGGGVVCTKCGDEECGLGENKCNCPEDCQ